MRSKPDLLPGLRAALRVLRYWAPGSVAYWAVEMRLTREQAKAKKGRKVRR